MLHSILFEQQLSFYVLRQSRPSSCSNAHTTLSQPLPSQETDMIFVLKPAVVAAVVVVAVATQQPNTVHSALNYKLMP